MAHWWPAWRDPRSYQIEYALQASAQRPSDGVIISIFNADDFPVIIHAK